MEEFEYQFEKSINDWKGVLACFLRFWYLPVIVLILSGMAAFMLERMDSKNDAKNDNYTVDCCLYIERDYNNMNLPSMDNVSVLLSSDIVWEQVNSYMQTDGSPAVSEEERMMIQGKVTKESDFYHIIIQGEELERINQISDNLLKVLEVEIKTLEGFNGCRLVSKSETGVKVEHISKDIILYGLVFGLIIGGCIIILISMVDKRIWSDYDLKLYFGRGYLGKITRKEMKDGELNERFVQRLKHISEADLYANVSVEMLQSSQIKMIMNHCDRKIHSLDELQNHEAADKAEHTGLLLVVQKGITTSEDINHVLEDIQILGLDLAGCVMIL